MTWSTAPPKMPPGAVSPKLTTRFLPSSSLANGFAADGAAGSSTNPEYCNTAEHSGAHGINTRCGGRGGASQAGRQVGSTTTSVPASSPYSAGRATWGRRRSVSAVAGPWLGSANPLPKCGLNRKSTQRVAQHTQSALPSLSRAQGNSCQGWQWWRRKRILSLTCLR